MDISNETQEIIFTYNTTGSFCYKTSTKSSKYLVFLDGMGGNILSIPYFANLKTLCDKNNIVLVYPQLRSHPNFCLHRIEDDVEDIDNIMAMLDGEVLLLGHSTGCQDSLLYIQHSQDKKVKGIILQAPVSDTEERPETLPAELTKIKEKKDEMFCSYEGRVWLRERFLTALEPYNK